MCSVVAQRMRCACRLVLPQYGQAVTGRWCCWAPVHMCSAYTCHAVQPKGSLGYPSLVQRQKMLFRQGWWCSAAATAIVQAPDDHAQDPAHMSYYVVRYVQRAFGALKSGQTPKGISESIFQTARHLSNQIHRQFGVVDYCLNAL